MSKSVDIPGAVTVIAALVGASLLGVVGALLAIPTAAAILLLVREVVIRSRTPASRRHGPETPLTSTATSGSASSARKPRPHSPGWGTGVSLYAGGCAAA